MSHQCIAEELNATYHDLLADLTLGKNLEAHFLTVSAKIAEINELLDNRMLADREIMIFTAIGFGYYRLKDKMVQAIVSNLKSKER